MINNIHQPKLCLFLNTSSIPPITVLQKMMGGNELDYSTIVKAVCERLVLLFLSVVCYCAIPDVDVVVV